MGGGEVGGGVERLREGILAGGVRSGWASDAQLLVAGLSQGHPAEGNRVIDGLLMGAERVAGRRKRPWR